MNAKEKRTWDLKDQSTWSAKDKELWRKLMGEKPALPQKTPLPEWKTPNPWKPPKTRFGLTYAQRMELVGRTLTSVGDGMTKIGLYLVLGAVLVLVLFVLMGAIASSG